SFAGDNNYNSASGTGTIDIAKANAATTVNAFSGSYDGQAHSLTGSATGVQGEDLSSELDLGASQTNAGSYDVSWTFSGDSNYNSSSGSSSTIDIAKVDATITVTAFS